MENSSFAGIAFGVSVLALTAAPLAAQDNTSEIQALRAQIEAMQKQLDRLEAEAKLRDSAPPPPPPPVAETSGAFTNPLRLGSEQNFIDISAIGTFAAGGSTEKHVEDLQPGGHDPQRRGFNVQGVELTLSGIVDPYFRAQTNIVFHSGGHSHHGEGGSNVELEEAFLETLALPANLQLRGGLFLTEFGRHNTQHIHAWSFVDQPLINSRMFGGDGLRNPGARISWLAPTPFFSELFFTVQDSTGETAYSFRNPDGFRDHTFFRGNPIEEHDAEEIGGIDDLLYTVRYAASTDFGEGHTLLGGISSAFGPNSPTEDSAAGRTEIYGADLYWHWSPADQVAGYPFVAWQTEAMLRRFEMRNPSETFEDYGFYTQLSYGFTRGWVAGLRYDWIRGAMKDAETEAGESLELPNRWRLSPNLTFHPSEFSRIRLQYNYDERDGDETDHTVWLQVQFSIGPHGAHTF